VLNRVLDLLSARGWFDVSRPFETTINLTQGACLWLMLTRNGVSDTYVKFSDCASLEQEAQRCAAASRSYPALVPRFVGHANHEGMNVLVCRAVDYCGLNASRLHRSNMRSHVLRDLNHYFATMRAAHLPRSLTPVRNAELVENLAAYFDRHELAPLARRWLRSDAVHRATRLPDVPQHGDLVLNNIGETRHGGAVVFDWEDFGASCLPGLDLFTLELSLAGDAARLASGRERSTDRTQRFVRSACEALQLDFGEYTALTSLYGLVFRHLKRNYGPGVRKRMDRLLTDLERQALSK
jgi:hypothetical protein